MTTTATKTTQRTDLRSICCNASPNEFTDFCTECREHTEYVDVTRWTDGEPVATDHRGMVRLESDTDQVNRLIANEREYVPETFRARFKRNFNPDIESLVGVSFLIVGFLVFYALTGLVGVGK